MRGLAAIIILWAAGGGTAAAQAASPCRDAATGMPILTGGPCPGAKRALDASLVPSVEPGLWRKSTPDGRGNYVETESCGDPLESVRREIARAPQLYPLGCSSQVMYVGPHNLHAITQCPAAARDGQEILIDVPSPHTVAVAIRASDDHGLGTREETWRASRIGDCNEPSEFSMKAKQR